MSKYYPNLYDRTNASIKMHKLIHLQILPRSDADVNRKNVQRRTGCNGGQTPVSGLLYQNSEKPETALPCGSRRLISRYFQIFPDISRSGQNPQPGTDPGCTRVSTPCPGKRATGDRPRFRPAMRLFATRCVGVIIPSVKSQKRSITQWNTTVQP